MGQQDHIEKFFGDVSKQMTMFFEGWEQDLPHDGERGGIRERRVADLLRLILPKRFGVGAGHIIDNQNGISKQTDIVIYDAFDGIQLPRDPYYSIFPCESVAAVIEVKSTLTASDGVKPGGTIFECIEAVHQIKSLHRIIDEKPVPIPYIVFAYQSNWKSEKEAEKVMEWFYKLTTNSYQRLPDIIFVLSPGYLISPISMPTKIRSCNMFMRAPLLLFISTLITLLKSVHTDNPNLWDTYLSWKQGDLLTKIYKEDGTSYSVNTLGVTKVWSTK